MRRIKKRVISSVSEIFDCERHCDRKVWLWMNIILWQIFDEIL